MTKRVSLGDETYARLKRYQVTGESISQTIDRLIEGQSKDPLGFPERVPKARISTQRWLEEIDADREDSRVEG